MRVLRRGEAGPDQPLGALALREVVGGVDGVEARDALRLDVGDERVGDVGEDHSAGHVDVVGLDELAEPRQRGSRDASLSSRMTSSLRPAICQPLSSQNSSQPLYMSLPAWAMAPDSGARKPILIGPWANAAPAASIVIAAIVTAVS